MRRAVAAHGAAAADAATGHVHDQRQRADRLGGGDGRAHVAVVVHVAADGDGAVAELLGQLAAPVGVAVEDGDTEAELGQATHGRRPETPGTPGDQR